MIHIVSVDVGVRNLALCLIQLEDDYTFHESSVQWFKRIDMTTFVHRDRNARKTCHLYHEKTYTDYLEHVFHLHSDIFDTADHILIERQPPQGYVVVQELIFSKFRDKSILISPTSVHCHFGWTILKMDYETRKDKSVEVARAIIQQTQLLEQFDLERRKHDIADCICITQYWASRRHLEWKKEENQRRIDDDVAYAEKNGLYHSHIFLDQFKYTG